MDSSLHLPRTRKSISIARAFALLACVRACEAACARSCVRGMSPLWLEMARLKNLGVPPPSWPASRNNSVAWRWPANPCKSLQIDCKLLLVASRCFWLLPAAFPLLPVVFRLEECKFLRPDTGHQSPWSPTPVPMFTLAALLIC